MNNGMGGSESELVAFYNFDEGSGNIIEDMSSNSNHAIMYNALEWVQLSEIATEDDGSCYYEITVTCYEDADGDNYYNDSQDYTACEASCSDFGSTWSTSSGSGIEVNGCTDSNACNYNSEATEEDDSCIYVDGICETCSGATDGTGSVVDNDSDDDNICNEFDPCPYWPYNCSDDGNTLIVAEGQSIGDAVDAVPNGGTILIMQGTHLTPSTINTQGKGYINLILNKLIQNNNLRN